MRSLVFEGRKCSTSCKSKSHGVCARNSKLQESRIWGRHGAWLHAVWASALGKICDLSQLCEHCSVSCNFPSLSGFYPVSVVVVLVGVETPRVEMLLPASNSQLRSLRSGDCFGAVSQVGLAKLGTGQGNNRKNRETDAGNFLHRNTNLPGGNKIFGQMIRTNRNRLTGNYDREPRTIHVLYRRRLAVSRMKGLSQSSAGCKKMHTQMRAR